MSLNDELLTRLKTAVDPVYDGLVPVDDKGRPLVQRYAVLYAAPGQRTAEDMARTADRFDLRFQVTSVGEDRRQAEWVATRCRDALLDERLVADGWHLGVIEHYSSSPIRRDEDIPGDPLFYAVDTYALPATR